MNPVPMSTLAEHDVIVIDPGSGYIKAGFAGEDIPRVVIPSIAIHLANQAVPAEVSHVFKDLEWVFGYAALDALRLALEATGKQTLAVIRPIERGVIKDWEAFELLIEHVICVSLAVREPALVRPLSAQLSLTKLLFPSISLSMICFSLQFDSTDITLIYYSNGVVFNLKLCLFLSHLTSQSPQSSLTNPTYHHASRSTR